MTYTYTSHLKTPYMGKKDFYIALSLQLANYLCHKGFDIKKVEDSYSNPDHKVFFFERSELLEKLADEYIKLMRQQKATARQNVAER